MARAGEARDGKIWLGDRPLDARRFIATARFLDHFDPVFDHIARRTAVLAGARRENLAVLDDELQDEADNYRRVFGLHRAEEMNAWLASLDYTLDDFEEEMEYRLVRRKKRAAFTRREVEAAFREQRSDFDRARLSQIVVASESLARELIEQVEAEGKDFAALAAKHSLDDATRDAGGHVGWMRRRDLAPELAPSVFAAKPGRCTAPVELDDGSFQTVLVHETRAATLDAAVEEELREALAAEWVEGLAAALRARPRP